MYSLTTSMNKSKSVCNSMQWKRNCQGFSQRTLMTHTRRERRNKSMSKIKWFHSRSSQKGSWIWSLSRSKFRCANNTLRWGSVTTVSNSLCSMSLKVKLAIKTLISIISLSANGWSRLNMPWWSWASRINTLRSPKPNSMFPLALKLVTTTTTTSSIWFLHRQTAKVGRGRPSCVHP